MENREVGFVVNDEYKAWIEDIKKRIRQSQIKAAVKVNYELLELYWGIEGTLLQSRNMLNGVMLFLQQ